MKIPLLIATTFGTREEIEELNRTHKSLKYQEELFSVLKSPSKVKIPVALTVFEAYYKKSNFYKYLDEYTFEDKIFIFDGKNPVNDNYQKSDSWLSNLKRTNNLTYYGYKQYNPKHHRKSNEHINWIDGNSDSSSKLKNILKLDLSNAKDSFEPKEKKISIENNWYQGGRINWYSAYFLKNNSSDLNNLYNEINYGKHKYEPKNAKALFDSWINVSNCQSYSSLYSSNLRISDIDYDGYDGICDGFDIWGSSNWDFSNEYSKKWTTPYAAYRRSKPKYWIDEYYYYSLGALQNHKGFGENWNQSREKKTLWNINYDDIFVVTNNRNSIGNYSKIQLGLNFKKIKNKVNFLKVSHLLDFKLHISVDGVPKQFKFTLDDLMKEKNENAFDLKLINKYKEPLFSDVFVTVSKRTHNNDDYVELLNKGEGNFKYTVNISELVNNEKMISNIEFSTDNLNKYYASEMFDKEKLKKFFFITNGKNKKSNISDEIFDKLNVRIDFDDFKGVLSVKYYDFLNDLESEGYSNNMKIIPDPKDYNLSSLDNAKEILKKKYSEDTTDYLWNSIDLVTKSGSEKDYEILVKHTNPEVKAKWEEVFKDSINSFSNNEDLSLIPLYSKYNPNAHYNSSNISSLFRLNDNAYHLGLNMNDYKFAVRRINNEIHVTVSLGKDFENQEKIYIFKDSAKTNLDLVQFSDFSNKDFPSDNEQKEMFKYSMIALGILLTSSVSSLAILELLKVLNKRKFYN